MSELPVDVAKTLPARYLAALEAFAAGESDEVLAERIDVDPTAALAAVRLAAGKLLAAMSDAAEPRTRSRARTVENA